MSTPDVEAIAAELTADEWRVVRTWLDEFGILPDRWMDVPPVRTLVCTLATVRRARAIQSRPRVTTSWTVCMEIAAGLLGLNSSAVEARLRGWKHSGRRVEWRTPRRTPGA